MTKKILLALLSLFSLVGVSYAVSEPFMVKDVNDPLSFTEYN
jgi:hypothetical protein